MTRKPVMHLLITDKCDRDCKWCCNKQYDVNDIPSATKEEYESVNTVCLTGGEPFEYSIPSDVATWLKSMAQINGIMLFGEQSQKRCLYALNMMMDQELLQHPSQWMANGI